MLTLFMTGLTFLGTVPMYTNIIHRSNVRWLWAPVLEIGVLCMSGVYHAMFSHGDVIAGVGGVMLGFWFVTSVFFAVAIFLLECDEHPERLPRQALRLKTIKRAAQKAKADNYIVESRMAPRYSGNNQQVQVIVRNTADSSYRVIGSADPVEEQDEYFALTHKAQEIATNYRAFKILPALE